MGDEFDTLIRQGHFSGSIFTVLSDSSRPPSAELTPALRSNAAKSASNNPKNKTCWIGCKAMITAS
jgi:hypothetical protein